MWTAERFVEEGEGGESCTSQGGMNATAVQSSVLGSTTSGVSGIGSENGGGGSGGGLSTRDQIVSGVVVPTVLMLIAALVALFISPRISPGRMIDSLPTLGLTSRDKQEYSPYFS